MLTTERAVIRLRHLAAAAAVGVLACAGLAAAPAQASTTPTTKTWTATTHAPILTVAPLSTAQQYQADVVTATNAQRRAHGLAALTVTSCLQTLATNWASHLAATGTFTHQSLGPFLTRCSASSAGENIAMGNVTAANVVTMWMNSPEHRANLLSSSFRHVAVGAVRAGGVWYVVQDFSG
ncbi:MAG: CAP domain-containing protein [Actinomycetales bacterium]